jgi:hypothetical protein
MRISRWPGIEADQFGHGDLSEAIMWRAQTLPVVVLMGQSVVHQTH